MSLDLPPGVTIADAVAYNERMARGDGVERIDADGTVHFSARARDAVASFAPELAEPLAIAAIEERAARLDALLDVEGQSPPTNTVSVRAARSG